MWRCSHSDTMALLVTTCPSAPSLGPAGSTTQWGALDWGLSFPVTHVLTQLCLQCVSSQMASDKFRATDWLGRDPPGAGIVGRGLGQARHAASTALSFRTCSP